MGCEKSKIDTPKDDSKSSATNSKVKSSKGVFTEPLFKFKSPKQGPSGLVKVPQCFNGQEVTECRNRKRYFTDFQVDIVHSTWPLLSSDLTATGISIFLDIFNTEPAIKKVFPNFQGQRTDKLKGNLTFQSHARKFMETLSSMCDMLPVLDPDAPTSRKLMVLGAHHATLPGFDITYFSIFLKCLHLTWERALREEYTPDVREVWNTIFEFVIERIRDGYMIYHEEQPNGHTHCPNNNSSTTEKDPDSSCVGDGITSMAVGEQSCISESV